MKQKIRPSQHYTHKHSIGQNVRNLFIELFEKEILKFYVKTQKQNNDYFSMNFAFGAQTAK